MYSSPLIKACQIVRTTLPNGAALNQVTQSVVRLLVEMLAPYKGRIYDSCCGSGGMVRPSKVAWSFGRRLEARAREMKVTRREVCCTLSCASGFGQVD